MEDVAVTAGGLRLRLRLRLGRGVTDLAGQGAEVGLPRGGHVETCSVRAFDEWQAILAPAAAPDWNRRVITGLVRHGLRGKARMTEDEMRDLIVRHPDDETPTDIDEMVDTALGLAELFEEAADDEVQLGLDELVLDAATALSALDANERGDGDEQDDAIADAGSAAADVNNEGVASQVAFVLAKNGLEEGRTKLNDILGVPVSPTP